MILDEAKKQKEKRDKVKGFLFLYRFSFVASLLASYNIDLR